MARFKRGDFPIPKTGFTRSGILIIFAEQGWVSNGHWCVRIKQTQFPLLFKYPEVTEEVLGVTTTLSKDPLKLDQMVVSDMEKYFVTRWSVHEWHGREATMLEPADKGLNVIYVDSQYAKHLGFYIGKEVWVKGAVVSDSNDPEKATFLLARINDDRQPPINLEASLALDNQVAKV